jgi:hypothetical protein
MMVLQTVRLPAAAKQTALTLHQLPPVTMVCSVMKVRPVTAQGLASQEFLLIVVTVSAVQRISAMKMVMSV